MNRFVRLLGVATGLALATACISDNSLSSNKNPEEEPVDSDTPVVEGPQPDIEVEPLSLDFGYLPEACPSDPLDVTVTNVGDEDLDVTDIQLVGPTPDAFHTNAAAVTLGPGESETFSVWFMAPADGAYDQMATRVFSNDPDEPEVDVSLLGNGADDAIVEDIFEQEPADSIDILWVIDNSGSMSDEVSALAGKFDTFINTFVNLGLDYQIAVITTDMDDPNDSGAFQGPVITPSTSDPITEFTSQAAQGSSGSGSEQTFDAVYTALTDSTLLSTTNAGFPRQDANLAVIAISDEDDDSDNLNASQFATFLDGVQGDPALSSFSAIAGPEAQGLVPWPCITFNTGSDAMATVAYPNAVKLTGGIHANICKLDFATVMTHLSYVAAGFDTTFQLSEEPVAAPTVTVDGTVVPQSSTDGWSWNGATNSIVFNGPSVPGPGSTIVVEYPIETECN